MTGLGCNLVAVLIFTWPKFSFLRDKNRIFTYLSLSEVSKLEQTRPWVGLRKQHEPPAVWGPVPATNLLFQPRFEEGKHSTKHYHKIVVILLITRICNFPDLQL